MAYSYTVPLMTLFPRFLSREVRSELADLSAPTEGILLNRLKEKPHVLFLFFQQAAASRGWCEQYQVLASRLFAQIYTHVIRDHLSFGGTRGFAVYMFHHNIFLMNRLAYVRDEKEFSGLITLQALPQMLPRFKEIEDGSTQLMAPFLSNDHEFKALYRSFYERDFGPFRFCSRPVLKNCLLQCKDWNYEEGLNALQMCFNERIYKALDAYEAYGFAVINGFDIIRKHCEKVLAEPKFYMVPHGRFVMYSELKTNFPRVNGMCVSESDLARLEYTADNSISPVFADALSEKLDVAWFEPESAQIGVCVIDPSLYLTYKNKFQGNELVNFPRPVKQLLVDRSTVITDACLVGFAASLPEIRDIRFRLFQSFHGSLFQDLKTVRPEITTFGFHVCTRIDRKTIEAISNFFPHLQNLVFDKTEVLNSLDRLSIPLKMLYINRGRLSQTHYGTRFESLITLSLFNMPWVSVKEIVHGACHISELKIVDIEGFTLNLYPYPANIIQLGIDTAALEASDIEKTLTAFSKLKEVTVLGDPTGNLKKSIVPFMQRIKFNFSKSK